MRGPWRSEPFPWGRFFDPNRFFAAPWPGEGLGMPKIAQIPPRSNMFGASDCWVSLARISE
eukprot:7487501-Pyramimonas_sp.AAC.1